MTLGLVMAVERLCLGVSSSREWSMFRGHEVGFCLGVHTAIPDVWLMCAFTRRRRLGLRFVPLATVDELIGPWLFSE